MNILNIIKTNVSFFLWNDKHTKGGYLESDGIFRNFEIPKWSSEKLNNSSRLVYHDHPNHICPKYMIFILINSLVFDIKKIWSAQLPFEKKKKGEKYRWVSLRFSKTRILLVIFKFFQWDIQIFEIWYFSSGYNFDTARALWGMKTRKKTLKRKRNPPGWTEKPKRTTHNCFSLFSARWNKTANEAPRGVKDNSTGTQTLASVNKSTVEFNRSGL